MGLVQNTTKPNTNGNKKLIPLVDIEEYPIPAYQFAIEMKDSTGADVTVALFQSVTGMAVKRELESLKEGGRNEYGYEFPGHITYEHITLQTGLTSSTFFWDWMMEGQFEGRARKMDFSLIQRRPNPEYSGKAGQDIFKEIKRWNFTSAFPVRWKISDLSLEDSEKIVLESLELAFGHFELGKS